MTALTELPTELLRVILLHLAYNNFPSLFAARRCCRVLEANVTDIVNKSLPAHGLAIHNFLQTHFAPLLDSLTAEKVTYLHDADAIAPLRELPWSWDPETRARFLRFEASWRHLPLASPSGTIIRRLQVVRIEWKSYRDSQYPRGQDVMHVPEDGNEDEMVYEQPGGVTIGNLYNVLVSQSWYGCAFRTNPLGTEWKVLFGKRVDNTDEFSKLGDEVQKYGRRVTEAEIKGHLTDDQGYATLWILGGKAGAGLRVKRPHDWNERWEPGVFREKYGEPSTVCVPFQ
ncbi:hypothetical protein K458DRAFT_432632 [Lentithecium fluviatile CBS 122367]|uniref:F-box domain-containing protein n=1 Tax=Lentithecium fluviatile CBS 122367 TaxID=1168545 RepID=A0A6G1IX12_9PLEO|nr:hypothetical protein K458DRAFT_432632 [Lentithecium fluviatile CBS 122367]